MPKIGVNTGIFHPIYTIENNCQDCYRCVRQCPVKAIEISDHRASIIKEKCIICGKCVEVCPTCAKRIQSYKPERFFQSEPGKIKIAALAPSYASALDCSNGELHSQLHGMGFSHISETALGAEIISQKVSKWIIEQPAGIYITSCCPVIVQLIQKYYPHHQDKITPFESPMIAHGRFLKAYCNQASDVAFASPCIAKIYEAQLPGSAIDCAITFAELSANISKNSPFGQPNEDICFYPFKAGLGACFPIDKGMIFNLSEEAGNSIETECISGLDMVFDFLNSIDHWPANKKYLFELMACKGGCINGPAVFPKGDLVLKKSRYLQLHHTVKYQNSYPTDSKQHEYYYPDLQPIKPSNHSNDNINSCLVEIGKTSEKDELNCNGCGYETCRAFASAILDGIAEPTMCVSFMRKTAQNQTAVLMKKIPYAVVFVDQNLKTFDANYRFAAMAGEDVLDIYKAVGTLKGADFRKIFPEYHYFEQIISSGADSIEKDIYLSNETVHLTLVTIQKHKLVCGLMHNFTTPEITSEEISRRSRQVIRQNLETVQKIAQLLGDNAANTELLLNTLVESHKKNAS